MGMQINPRDVREEVAACLAGCQREGALLVLPVLATAFFNPGASLVTLCGLTLKGRLLHGVIGVSLASFAWTVFTRYQEDPRDADLQNEVPLMYVPLTDRRILERASLVLVASSCV